MTATCRPDADAFASLVSAERAATPGVALRVPLIRRLLGDALTPVLAYRRLVRGEDRMAPSFLLDSVTGGGRCSTAWAPAESTASSSRIASRCAFVLNRMHDMSATVAATPDGAVHIRSRTGDGDTPEASATLDRHEEVAEWSMSATIAPAGAETRRRAVRRRPPRSDTSSVPGSRS